MTLKVVRKEDVMRKMRGGHVNTFSKKKLDTILENKSKNISPVENSMELIDDK